MSWAEWDGNTWMSAGVWDLGPVFSILFFFPFFFYPSSLALHTTAMVWHAVHLITGQCEAELQLWYNFRHAVLENTFSCISTSTSATSIAAQTQRVAFCCFTVIWTRPQDERLQGPRDQKTEYQSRTQLHDLIQLWYNNQFLHLSSNKPCCHIRSCSHQSFNPSTDWKEILSCFDLIVLSQCFLKSVSVFHTWLK